ncbi:MAG: DUF1501 domain-containing protein [Thermoanaerobaculia bacterium]
MPWDRRLFLKTSGLALLSFGAGPEFLHRAAHAATATSSGARKRTLVTIFQRGAMDGLAAVAPTGGRELAALRPRLALSAARAAGDGALLDLGVGFGLHPGFADLLPFWRDGSLAIVHAVGSPDATRSHFDAQDYMESGTPGRKGTDSGWLNRVCGELGHDATPFRAVAMTPALPRSLYGREPAVAISRLEDFEVRLPGAAKVAAAAGRGFEALYEQTSQELLAETGRETFDAVKMLSSTEIARYRPAPGVRYPAGPLGDALRQVAQLVKSDLGLEVAFVESGGWDTHVAQGAADGTFARRAGDLGAAIAAFWSDLGARRDDVTLMTMTEFGRTVRENGSGGTDHGHGSCLFVLGTGVDGGKVHGDFPGLDRDALYEGRDLPVTTDFRAVFAEVAGNHLGIANDRAIFPEWNGRRRPLWRRS